MVASTEDVALAIRTLSDSRRLRYEVRAAEKGLTLSEYLANKLDNRATADARTQSQQPGSSAKPLTENPSKTNRQQEVIEIPDDDDVDLATQPPPAKKRRTQDEAFDDAAFHQRMQAARPMSIVPQSRHHPSHPNLPPYGNTAGPHSPNWIPSLRNPPPYPSLPAPPTSQPYLASSQVTQSAQSWSPAPRRYHGPPAAVSTPHVTKANHHVDVVSPDLYGSAAWSMIRASYPDPRALQNTQHLTAPSQTTPITQPLPLIHQSFDGTPVSNAVRIESAANPALPSIAPLSTNQALSSDFDAPPSSKSVPTHSQMTKSANTIRNCSRSDVGDDESMIVCANSECPIGTYHEICVGMKFKFLPGGGWQCKKCKGKAQYAASKAKKLETLESKGAQAVKGPKTAAAKVQQSQASVARVVPTAKGPRESVAYTETEPRLSGEQKRVVDAITAGSNVFYTGSAGTGKSTVLKAFVRNLKQQGKQVDIIAPSGIAALAVGGTTIFSYAGWTPDSLKRPLRELLKSAHGKNVRKRLCRTDCLVIDEISMVERDLLVRLDRVMREARHGYHPGREDPMAMSSHNAMQPFGGAQIIVTGDFCQLPPVRPFKFCVNCGGDELEGWSHSDGRDLKCRKCKLEHRDQDKWAFASPTWDACEFTYIELSTIHRQNDKKFINILQTCRVGTPLSSFQQKVLLVQKPDPESAVKLMPTRVEVDRENNQRFRQLPGAVLSFHCRDLFDWRNQNEPELQWKGASKYPNRPEGGPLKALSDHRFEEQIDIKKDMLVILLVNLDFTAGLVNGSQGRIVGFEKYDPNKILVPTKPVSSTGDRDSFMSPKKRNGKGQFTGSSQDKYRGGSGPEQQLGEMALLKNEEVHAFMRSQLTEEWPIVQFTNGQKRTIYAHCQLNELGTEQPYSILGRTQIPLLASWAITCHKSQGMTLNRVIVDLHNSFERGMVYVALSRATNLEGLKVVRLPKVMDIPGNVEVQTWLKEKFGKKKLV